MSLSAPHIFRNDLSSRSQFYLVKTTRIRSVSTSSSQRKDRRSPNPKLMVLPVSHPISPRSCVLVVLGAFPWEFRRPQYEEDVFCEHRGHACSMARLVKRVGRGWVTTKEAESHQIRASSLLTSPEKKQTQKQRFASSCKGARTKLKTHDLVLTDVSWIPLSS